MSDIDYLPRLVDPYLDDILRQLPGLMVVGPRATGKTTTIARRARTTINLAAAVEAAAFRADPDAALRGLDEPVLLDEWQEVPGVFGAASRAIDSEPRPSRYFLTGSVRAHLENRVYAGTGRIVRVPMYPMTVRERRGDATSPAFLDKIATTGDLVVPGDTPDLLGYVELALESGFPVAALRLGGVARDAALEGYVDDLLTQDVEHLEQLQERRRGVDRSRLRRYFEAYALNSSGIVDDKTLYDSAGINRAFDPALIAAALRVDARGVLRDGDLLGRVLDTFVAAQLRPELVVSPSKPRLYHLRTKGGRQEVDLLAELGGGRIVGVEIKATAAPGQDDAKHLAWLRDQLGDRFVGGVVLHTGPRRFRLGDRIEAAPISVLWG